MIYMWETTGLNLCAWQKSMTWDVSFSSHPQDRLCLQCLILTENMEQKEKISTTKILTYCLSHKLTNRLCLKLSYISCHVFLVHILTLTFYVKSCITWHREAQESVVHSLDVFKIYPYLKRETNEYKSLLKVNIPYSSSILISPRFRNQFSAEVPI